MRMPPEMINKVIPRFLQDGWQVVRVFIFCSGSLDGWLNPFCMENVHAIGDRAMALF